MAITRRGRRQSAQAPSQTELFGSVLNIMLATYPKIVEWDTKKSLKLTCKTIKAAMDPFYSQLCCSDQNLLTKCISASVTNGGIWDSSCVQSSSMIRIYSAEVFQDFASLPLPILKSLLLSDIAEPRIPSIVADGNWPHLTSLSLSFDLPWSGKNIFPHEFEANFDLAKLGQASWPLKSLSLSMQCPPLELNMGPALASLLPAFPGLTSLDLKIGDMYAIDTAASIAAAHLPALQHLGFSAYPRGDLVALAVGHWPKLKSFALSSCTITVEDAHTLANASWIQGLTSLSLSHNEMGSDELAAILQGLKGGRLEFLSVDPSHDSPNSFMLAFKDADLPYLKKLFIGTVSDEYDLKVLSFDNLTETIPIDQELNSLFSANLPLVETICFHLPSSDGKIHVDDVALLWKDPPLVPVATIFPSLKNITIAKTAVTKPVLRYLKGLCQRSVQIEIMDGYEETLVELTPELEETMDKMMVQMDELDHHLKEQGMWYAFWCWDTLNAEERKALVYEACLYNVVYKLEEIPPELPSFNEMRHVVEALDKTEDPTLQKLALKNKELLDRTRNIINEFEAIFGRYANSRFN